MPRYTDDQFATALTECKGLLFVSARRLGCSYHTIQRRIARCERLQEIVAEQAGQMLDTAELKLYQAITNGELGAIKFYLSTRGKDRGYVERQEQHHSGPAGGPFSLTVRVVDDRQLAEQHVAPPRQLNVINAA